MGERSTFPDLDAHDVYDGAESTEVCHLLRASPSMTTESSKRRIAGNRRQSDQNQQRSRTDDECKAEQAPGALSVDRGPKRT